MSEVPVPETKLQHKWSWYYKPTITYKQQSAADWMADYRKVVPASFETVEQFWAIYNHMHALHELDYGNIYAIFRDNIEPVWEHEQNKNGFSIILYTNKTAGAEYIGRLYQFTLLTLIGNNAPFSHLLNGCTLERKTGGNKIVFWFREEQTPKVREQIIQQILSCLEVPQEETVLCELNVRVDWWDPQFINYKIVISYKSHSVAAAVGGGVGQLQSEVKSPPHRYNPNQTPSSSSSNNRNPYQHRSRSPSDGHYQKRATGPPGGRYQHSRK